MRNIPIPTFVLVTLIVVSLGAAIFLGLNPEPEKENIPVSATVSEDTLIQFDEGVDIGDRVMTIDFAQPRTLVLEGEPRMVSPQAVIDFSGDKVTYSGDLPIDESAKIFFDFVMGFVIEARECK